MKLNRNGHFSQTSATEVKQVPLLVKIGFGLKKCPQHFFTLFESKNKKTFKASGHE